VPSVRLVSTSHTHRFAIPVLLTPRGSPSNVLNIDTKNAHNSMSIVSKNPLHFIQHRGMDAIILRSSHIKSPVPLCPHAQLTHPFRPSRRSHVGVRLFSFSGLMRLCRKARSTAYTPPLLVQLTPPKLYTSRTRSSVTCQRL
jgi:hypothetical protein